MSGFLGAICDLTVNNEILTTIWFYKKCTIQYIYWYIHIFITEDFARRAGIGVSQGIGGGKRETIYT
jgi:hypothetical protein